MDKRREMGFAEAKWFSLVCVLVLDVHPESAISILCWFMMKGLIAHT